MSLIRYWPTREEVNRCIKAEAESASDAVLLAVHQPIPLQRRDEGSDVTSQVSEHDLLEAFLSQDLPQGTLLMPITGPSGAGKSHLIRWLAAQLGRDPRARHMHVIRIPKSASLRDVVELVLEPLSGDARFSEIRESLDKAIAQVTPFEAAVRFSGALEIALGGLKNRFLAELKNNPLASELKTRAYHAAKLPGFLNDAALRDHMTNHVLAPIIQRAVTGRAELRPDDEELLPQFRANDLCIPDKLRSALGRAATPVQSYYQTGLNRADGAGREQAAKVLNEVVDEAIQQVFRLDRATGGVTLESIILRVRELLLEQGRELVLLVEDFAALSGIQQVLLNVCIQEAERDGRQIRSRMRSALALTEGYLVARDTVATRARQEWVIQQATGTDDVVARTVELIGAYLNAARWGEQALKRQYHQSARENEADLTAWIETFVDEDLIPKVSDQLTAFGASDRGVPLFPYNRPAIAELAKRHLRTAGEIRFNPRHIINFILRDILLSGRDAFEKGDFPPRGFEDAKASASLASWLSAQTFSEQERRRVEATLVYWGGNPGDPTQALVPEQVFDAFGLKRPTGLGKNGPTVVTSKPTPRSTTPSPPPLTPREDVQVTQWRQKLEAWANGTELGQQDANRLRNVLKRAIEKAVPWNSLRLAGRRSVRLALNIPNARGNPTAGISLWVAQDHRDPDGELRNTFLGAIRLELFQDRLDYSYADEDSARLANLVERLVTELLPPLEEERAREVRVLAWMLERQARVLGLTPRTRMKVVDAKMEGVRARVDEQPEVENLPPKDSTERWVMLRRDAIALRSELQEALWNRTACFQGDGNTVYALDPTLLNISGGEEQADLEFLTNVHRLELLTNAQGEHLTQLKPTRIRATTRPLVDQLRKLSTRVDNLLGPARDKQGLILALSNLLDVLEPVGVWPDGISRPTFKRDIESFRNDDVKKQLDEAGPLLDANAQIDLAADSTLERLGRLNLAVLERVEAFLNQMETFIDAVERDLNVKDRELIGVNPEADAETLAHILNQVDRDLCTITEGMADDPDRAHRNVARTRPKANLPRG